MATSNVTHCDFDKQKSVAFCRTHHVCLCLDCVISKTHDTGDCKLIKEGDLKEGDRMMMGLISLKQAAQRKLNCRSDLLSEYDALKKRLNADVETFYKSITTKLSDMHQETQTEIETNINKATQPFVKDKEVLQSLETKLGESIIELQPTLNSSDGGIGDHSTRLKYEKLTDEAKPKLEKIVEYIPNPEGSFMGLKLFDKLEAESVLGKVHIDDKTYDSISSDMYLEPYQHVNIKKSNDINQEAYQHINIKKSNDTNQPGDQAVAAPGSVPPVPEKTYRTQKEKDEHQEKEKIEIPTKKSKKKSDPKPSGAAPKELKTQKSAEATMPEKDVNSKPATAPDKPKSKGIMQKIFGGGKARRESVEVGDAATAPVTPVTPETVKTIEIETEFHKDEHSPCKFKAIHALEHDRIVLLDTSHNAVVLTDYQGHLIHQKTFESEAVCMSAMSKSKIAVLMLEGPTIHTFELVDESTFSENRPIPVAHEITDIVGFAADAGAFAIITVSAVHIVKDSGADSLSIPNVPSSGVLSNDMRSAYDFKTRTQYVLNISRKSIKAFSFDNDAYVWKRKVDDDNFKPHGLVLQKMNTATVWIICHNQILAADADEVKELKTEPGLASALAVCAGHKDGKLLVTESSTDKIRAKTVRVLTLQK